MPEERYATERFRHRLRAARQKVGLTQAQAAEKAGFEQPLWSSYERGLRVPSISQVYRMAAAMKISPKRLI